MGYGANIDDVSYASYTNTESLRAHRAYSSHTTDIHEGRASRGVHKDMNPRGIRREARDSDVHPTSLPIAVLFDVTGSMGEIPREVQRRLTNLMRLLVQRGYVAHPQVMFGAIGDATCDSGPLQIGQFEAGLDMDKDLERVWVEGGGGGGHHESYELGHYFVARHVVTDAWDKRNQKGYLFTMGDEAPYDAVSRSAVQRLMGDNLQADIPLTELMAELQQKWHVFHLLARTSTSQSDATIGSQWRALLPAGHVIDLADGKNVAEVVGLIVGIMEGKVEDAESDLAQLGVDGDSVKAVIETIAPFARTRGIRLDRVEA